MNAAAVAIDRSDLFEFAPDALIAVDETAAIVLANSRAAELFGYSEREVVGRPVSLLMPDCDGDWLTEGALKYANVDGSNGREPQLLGRKQDGSEFRCEVALSAIETGTGRLAMAAIRDVTERDHAGQRLRLAMQRLKATTDVAVAVGAETDLDRVLELIVERGRDLVEARTMMVLLEDGDGLVVSAIAGELGEEMRGHRFESAGELLRLAFKLESSDTTLSVSLNFRGRRLGTMLAIEHLSTGARFSGDDRRMLKAFAASAATAVATAKSVESDRLRNSVAAAERERGHWARALHDETLQGLAGLRIALVSALRSDSPETMRARVGWAVKQVSSEVSTLRALITELRPAALDELGLEAALHALVSRSENIDHLQVERSIAPPRREYLSPDIETTIYRLAQEALNNVAKHAQTATVQLTVKGSTRTVRLQVCDEGVGFDPRIADEGFGLRGMRERAGLVGASIEIDSAPGRGTKIRAEIPIGPAATRLDSREAAGVRHG